jgi:aminopeptidase N
MWVHEGFCTYSEALYVECLYGYDQMISYISNQKKKVRNNKPIIGPYDVNKSGSTDMYYKGSLMLHTLRSLIQDDVLWFRMLKDITNHFRHQTIDGQDIIDFINNYTNTDFTSFFKQYLNNKDLPQFQYKLQKEGKNYTIIYRWEAIKDFDMPVLINLGYSEIWIYPENEWKESDIGSFDKKNFSVRDDLLFIDIKKM